MEPLGADFMVWAERDSAQVAGGNPPEVMTLSVRHALGSQLIAEVHVRPSSKVKCLHEDILVGAAKMPATPHIVFQSRVLEPRNTIAEAGLAHGDTVFVMWGSQRCLMASGDGALRLWQMHSGDGQEPMLMEPAGEVLAFSLSACRAQLLTMTIDGEGEAWRTATGARKCLLNGLMLTGEFSPDGRWIVGVSDDDVARVWCAETGNCKMVLKMHASDINSASFSPDGRHIVTSSDDGTACIWAADTGKCAHLLEGHKDTVKSAAFSPDGHLVITASMDATARVWSAASGRCLRLLEGHANTLSGACFSPTMNQMITASFDHTVKVWSAESGECLFTVPALDKATYSPDGCTVLVASGSEDLRLFDANSGNLLATLSGHEEWVRAASFSSDGLLIASASYDGTVRIWSAADGKCLQTLSVHPSTAVFTAEFTN